jgi:hypothetical protein
VQPPKRDATDLLRSVGGLLFAAGAVALLIRKSESGHTWDDFARLLVLLIPTVTLYVLALGPPKHASTQQDARAWQTVLAVLAILLWPLTLLEALQWLGASTGNSLEDAGVLAITAMLAAYAAQRARVSYAVLLAGLATLAAWSSVWSQILKHESTDTSRWLLVAAAILLLAAAGWLRRGDAIGAGELATAGGIAAVAAGAVGVFVGLFVGATQGIGSVLESNSSSSAGLSITPTHRGRLADISARHHAFAITRPHALAHTSASLPKHSALGSLFATTNGLQHFGWDLYLLIVSVALVWIGSHARNRGLGYVGAAGLLTFVISVGVEVTRFESGRASTGAIVGWPLALLAIGVAGLAAPALLRRDASA